MKRVIITCAAGNMGRKLARHLGARGGYELRLIDVAADIISGLCGAPEVQSGNRRLRS